MSILGSILPPTKLMLDHVGPPWVPVGLPWAGGPLLPSPSPTEASFSWEGVRSVQEGPFSWEGVRSLQEGPFSWVEARSVQEDRPTLSRVSWLRPSICSFASLGTAAWVRLMCASSRPQS